MQKIFIDYADNPPRSKSGNTVILICVDAFSKFIWLVPVREATSRMTIKALNGSIFGSFSVPEVLVSDNAHVSPLGNSDNFAFGWGLNTLPPHLITHSLPTLSVLIRIYALP